MCNDYYLGRICSFLDEIYGMDILPEEMQEECKEMIEDIQFLFETVFIPNM